MKRYIIEHKIYQVPVKGVITTFSVSSGQHYSQNRQVFRNAMKGLTRKQRQAARKSLKKRGVVFNA